MASTIMAGVSRTTRVVIRGRAVQNGIHSRSIRRCFATTPSEEALSDLIDDLPHRELPPTFEDLTATNSWRLSRSLSDFLPSSVSRPSLVAPTADLAQDLPIGHHLVYFEPSRPEQEMLADGTNPDHSPGAPFSRRMWAGGRVAWNPDAQARLVLDGARGVCAEFIRGATIKGTAGQEKIFVEVERRMARASADEAARMTQIAQLAPTDESVARLSRHRLLELEHRVRQRLWRREEEDFGPCAIVETRNIVFMRDRPSSAESASTSSNGNNTASPPKRKTLQPPSHEPAYAHTLTPSAQLLFRFSALTFNAHKIHLDPGYARDVEGHAGGLLLHGPLSLVLTLTLLKHHLGSSSAGSSLRSLEYRNLAPLYAEQEAKFCGAQTGDKRWEVWTQAGDGGLAIKGTARVE